MLTGPAFGDPHHSVVLVLTPSMGLEPVSTSSTYTDGARPRHLQFSVGVGASPSGNEAVEAGFVQGVVRVRSTGVRWTGEARRRADARPAIHGSSARAATKRPWHFVVARRRER